MAQLINAQLPGGWVQLKYDILFQNLYLEKNMGGVEIQQNWPRALWMLTVSYNREKFEGNFDEIYRFYLNTGAAFAFDVDDINDNTHNAGGASGVVEQVIDADGVSRYWLTKHYPLGDGHYQRVIYRPKNDVVLGSGATGGTLNAATGEVTGIASAGTWTGGFKIPMIFAAPLSYTTDPTGLMKAFNVQLREDPLL